MANPLYSQMNPNSFSSTLNALKNNPMQFIMQRRFNVPQNLTDPNAIVQHLLNSGQVTQQQYDRAKAMANQFKQ